jgi:hypothetical protein
LITLMIHIRHTRILDHPQGSAPRDDRKDLPSDLNPKTLLA